MSLATFGRNDEEGDVVLPIVEYDELDRTNPTTGEAMRGGQGKDDEGGRAEEESKNETKKTAPEDERPGWDPGPKQGWGARHGWGTTANEAHTFGWNMKWKEKGKVVIQTLTGNGTEWQFQ